MVPACDIIVLTYNKLELSKEFFKSLEAVDLPLRIIAIDNASSDNTPDYLKSLKNSDKRRFECVFNPKNLGFVGGMNQGLSMCSSDYICLANNDIIFTKDWLSEIIYLFDKYQDIGLINPNSNTLGARPDSGQTIESFAGSLEKKYKGIFVEMPFCIGFCMVLRKNLLDKAGGLSPKYAPMFFEDTDFSKKAVKAGYRIGLAKGAYVWHKEHGSFKNKSRESESIFRKNKKIFQEKWGRILRIAWIAGSYDEMLDNLTKAIELARGGNFVTFYVKHTDVDREAVFREKGVFEHSGVLFKRFNSYPALFFRIMFKKKKFDRVIKQ
jgi:O-antigen biosynthesis protein